MMRRRTLLLTAPAVIATSRARAADAVKVGVMFPLTGNSAGSGGEAKAAVEVAADIINTGHPDLKDLTVGTTPGLPGLGGAKIEPVFVDHRGDPSMAQSLALKLITSDKVAALFGAYQSSAAMTATAVAERYGVPYRRRGFRCRQHHHARLQIHFPGHPDRQQLRRQLHAVSAGPEDGGAEG